MKFLHSILLLSLVAGCATKKEVRSVQRVKVPSTTLAADDMPEVRTPETVKAYPVGRYTDPNFPDQMHERHTLYRREQAADWNYRPSRPYSLNLGPCRGHLQSIALLLRERQTRNRLMHSRKPMQRHCSSRTLR